LKGQLYHDLLDYRQMTTERNYFQTRCRELEKLFARELQNAPLITDWETDLQNMTPEQIDDRLAKEKDIIQGAAGFEVPGPVRNSWQENWGDIVYCNGDVVNNVRFTQQYPRSQEAEDGTAWFNEQVRLYHAQNTEEHEPDSSNTHRVNKGKGKARED
jgi:hypothetical protein